MGRRKIEIKAIKDDRNRSVTFLKRKGGLFKKAHELSVLCSVDVAVIIFGHNKKLYEFSSGDINETIGRYQYYGGAHEHKGPEDFMGKKDVDDDEDDEDAMASPPRDSHTPPEQHAMMPHHLQNQAAFQHIRHQTPSASPPMPNGLPFHHRHSSPQPPTGVSRPNSRAHIRRPSSNLVPPQHQQPSQAPPPPNNYAYMPNPPFYQGPPPPHQPLSKPPPAHQQQQNPQYQQYHHPPPTHPQVQQFMQQQQQQQEPRRQSMPPTFSQERPQTSLPMPSPPQPEEQQQQQQQNFQSPPPPQPKALHPTAKHSIFTPIEDSRSMLALHWGSTSNSVDQPRVEGAIKVEGGGGVRSQSIDVASISRHQVNGNSPPQAAALPQQQQQQQQSIMPNHQQQQPQRTQSTSSVPTIAPPSRTNSMQTDPKRPRLKVQIPSEHSDAGSATADSSPNKESGGTTGATPARTSTDASHSSGVLLPPPSPSANSLLSAGATGPPNPFARPHPPPTNGSYGSRSEMETPISALPSRFVENGLLPSPSSFYPEWGFGRENNMLPSPLTFQTPVVPNGPNFGRDDASTERKRKTSEGSDGGGGGGGSTVKRVKA